MSGSPGLLAPPSRVTARRRPDVTERVWWTSSASIHFASLPSSSSSADFGDTFHVECPPLSVTQRLHLAPELSPESPLSETQLHVLLMSLPSTSLSLSPSRAQARGFWVCLDQRLLHPSPHTVPPLPTTSTNVTVWEDLNQVPTVVFENFPLNPCFR